MILRPTGSRTRPSTGPTLLVLAVCGLLAGCVTTSLSPYSPIADGPFGPGEPRPQIATASWYGPGFNGHRTARGEIFHQNDMTAASKTLPLGSHVKAALWWSESTIAAYTRAGAILTFHSPPLNG